MTEQTESMWVFDGTPEDEERHTQQLIQGWMERVLHSWGDHPMSKKNAKRLIRKINKTQAKIKKGSVLSEEDRVAFEKMKERFADACFSNPRLRMTAIVGAIRMGKNDLANHLVCRSMEMRTTHENMRDDWDDDYLIH